jgi:hypothetical protein
LTPRQRVIAATIDWPQLPWGHDALPGGLFLEHT